MTRETHQVFAILLNNYNMKIAFLDENRPPPFKVKI